LVDGVGRVVKLGGVVSDNILMVALRLLRVVEAPVMLNISVHVRAGGSRLQLESTVVDRSHVRSVAPKDVIHEAVDAAVG